MFQSHQRNITKHLMRAMASSSHMSVWTQVVQQAAVKTLLGADMRTPAEKQEWQM